MDGEQFIFHCSQSFCHFVVIGVCHFNVILFSFVVAVACFGFSMLLKRLETSIKQGQKLPYYTSLRSFKIYRSLSLLPQRRLLPGVSLFCGARCLSRRRFGAWAPNGVSSWAVQ